MDINKLRVAALKAVMAGATQKEFADQYGLDASYLSQILNGHRNLGEKAALRLEEKIGLDSGTLVSPAPTNDMDHVAPQDQPAAPTSAADLVKQMLAKSGKGISEETRQRLLAAAEEGQPALSPTSQIAIPADGDISIPQYDIRAAMGHGQVPAEYSEVIRNVVIREEVLREKGVTYTSAQALSMITGWGQSMEGTINDKDPVIVDRGVNDYQGEGVYVITWHGDLLIKRVQRQDEGRVWLISDNRNYEKQSVRIEDILIHAKVLMVWNARKI